MRIGLAGVGRIGAFHADTLRQLPAVDSVIAADADPARASAVAQRLGIEVAHSPGALFDSGIDALVIATATGLHAEFIVRGVRASLPVFCGFHRAYSAELAAFVRLAADGGASPCTMQDALEAFYIAEACEVSRARREPVPVAEVRR
jgi:myo-inositol 2-dehydrogenase / D-chiro-inositol 1-dehydrogenase